MKRKLLFITPHLSTGGLPQYLLKKIETFSKDFEIWCIEWDNITGGVFVVQRTQIQNLLGNNLITLHDKSLAFELIKSINPEIIHFEEIPETFISEDILEKIYSTERTWKILATTHSSNTQPETIKFTADKFVLVSKWSLNVFRSHFGESIDMDIWEYPIENKRPNKWEARKKIGFEEGWKHIVNVGLFTPGKNQRELFELARILTEYKIKFHFIGNQAMNFSSYWEPLMKEKPINCIVHGEKSNVEDYLASSDAFYFTSNFELNPLAVKEAISFGIPTFIKNLETYQNTYDGICHYITGNIQEDSKILIDIIKPEKRERKIKACHLLIDTTTDRESISIESMSQVEPEIEYIQCINQRYTGEEWRDQIPCSGWQNHGPGHFGAFQSFKSAIKTHLNSEVDYLMIFEADCVMDVEKAEFIQHVNRAIEFCEKYQLPLFSFGPRWILGTEQSPILETDKDFNNFVQTNRIIEAHCILVTKHKLDYLLNELEKGWDSPDIFFNHIFMKIGQRLGILRNPITHQEEGISMIDNIVKGRKSDIRPILTINNTNPFESLSKNESIIQKRSPKFNVHFIDCAFLEVKNTPNESYFVQFIDSKTDQVVYQTTIHNNCFAISTIKYFKEWLIRVERKSTGEVFEFQNNLNGKRVFISFESSSLGDTISWIPYVEEFRKKHKCQVICSTFWNHLFESEYPEIEFSPKGQNVPNIFACYRLGWFYKDGEPDYSKVPNNFRLQPMQKTASDILGLDYVEIKTRIRLKEGVEKENIVTIAIHGTAQSKYWNHPGGWQSVVDFVKSKGYRVVLISKEGNGYMGNGHPEGIEQLPSGPIEGVIEVLQKSKLFIGIGSGLSWVSWAVGTKTVIISGFSYEYTEPSEGVIRIKTPLGYCTGCFNERRLDPGDWNWCPMYKGTERQFECSKSITPEMVISRISNHI